MRLVNVISLVKGQERFVFLYDDESKASLLRQFARYAADRSINFTWFDAALLSQKVRHG